ncbi:MAG: hypothetical protein WD055_00750 [Candidatus Dependentiae bacterium]
MKKVVWCIGLLCAQIWSMDDQEQKKGTVVVGSGEVKIEDGFDVNKALDILRFCQRAKATDSAPNGYIPGTVATVLEAAYLKEPTYFEQTYSDLFTKVLIWVEQNILHEERTFDVDQGLKFLSLLQKAKATESFADKYVPKRLY